MKATFIGLIILCFAIPSYSQSTRIGSALPLVQEEDGDPAGRFRILKFPNNTLLDNNDGSFSFIYPSSGVFGYWSRTGTVLSPATSGDDISIEGISFLGEIDLGTNTINDGVLTGDWDFSTGDLETEGSIVTTQGNVGIGTDLPTSRLHVLEVSDAHAQIEMESTSATKSSQFLFTNDGGQSGGTANIGVGGTASGNIIQGSLFLYGRWSDGIVIVPGPTTGKTCKFYPHLLADESARMDTDGSWSFFNGVDITGDLTADTFNGGTLSGNNSGDQDLSGYLVNNDTEVWNSDTGNGDTFTFNWGGGEGPASIVLSTVFGGPEDGYFAPVLTPISGLFTPDALIIDGNVMITDGHGLQYVDASYNKAWGFDYVAPSMYITHSGAGTLFINGPSMAMLDNRLLYQGSALDVSSTFDGEDLVIHNEGITAGVEVHWTDFDKYVFDNDIDTTGDISVPQSNKICFDGASCTDYIVSDGTSLQFYVNSVLVWEMN